jgi:3-hydroxy-9,10-secoandrosta-1,3,5(10)-triene-9,17-dione monooxygenase
MTSSIVTAIRQSAQHDVVAAATALVPSLRSRGMETETLARLPDATVSDLGKARLFDMIVPKMYGGLQCSVETQMDAVVQVGRGDGSAAWTLALLAGGTWMAAAHYPQQVVDEVFASGRNIRVAGVLQPIKAKTRAVDGGIVIEDGLWRFNSGVEHADWDILGIPIFDQSGQVVDSGSALIPISQVTLLHDWDTIGLRGSGSTSVSVKDVFVPHERIALLSKALQEDHPASRLRNEPLYGLALVPFFATKLVFPILGMAQAALELFVEKAPHRGIPYTTYERQDEATVTHLQLGEASSKIDAADALLRRSARELDASMVGGRRMTLEQKARIWRDAGFACRLLWETVDLLASASGASFANAANPMNRLWRDTRVASLHGGLLTSTAMELFGRLLSGQKSNVPMLT